MDVNVTFIVAAGILAVALLGVPIVFSPKKIPSKQPSNNEEQQGFTRTR
jgi:hypothetical protein